MSNLAKVLCGLAFLSAMFGAVGCSKSGAPSATGTAPAAQSGDQQSSSTSRSSGSGDSAVPQPVTLPAGTALHVTLNQTLSSAQSHTGDDFRASLSEPVVVDGKKVILRGARVRGRVIEADPSGRLEHPGELRLTLRSVDVQGQKYDLKTSSVDRKGAGHEKRNAELIGGGAGFGALVGAIVGHGKGAAIGALAGAGAGTAGAAATGKQDVTVPAETGLSFRLNEAVTIASKLSGGF